MTRSKRPTSSRGRAQQLQAALPASAAGVACVVDPKICSSLSAALVRHTGVHILKYIYRGDKAYEYSEARGAVHRDACAQPPPRSRARSAHKRFIESGSSTARSGGVRRLATPASTTGLRRRLGVSMQRLGVSLRSTAGHASAWRRQARTGLGELSPSPALGVWHHRGERRWYHAR